MLGLSPIFAYGTYRPDVYQEELTRRHTSEVANRTAKANSCRMVNHAATRTASNACQQIRRPCLKTGSGSEPLHVSESCQKLLQVTPLHYQTRVTFAHQD